MRHRCYPSQGTFETLKLWDQDRAPSQLSRENPFYAFSLPMDGEDALEAWEAVRHWGPGSQGEVKDDHITAEGRFQLLRNSNHAPGFIAVRTEFDESDPDLCQIVDLSDGRSAYASTSLLAASSWDPQSRVVLRTIGHPDVYELLHPEGDAAVRITVPPGTRTRFTANPNIDAFVSFDTGQREVVRCLRLDLTHAGCLEGAKDVSLEDFPSAEHQLFTYVHADPSHLDYYDFPAIASESPTGRIWVTFYAHQFHWDLGRSPQHGTPIDLIRRIAEVPALVGLLSDASHPKQVMLRTALEGLAQRDAQGAWTALRRFGKRLNRHRYVKHEILGILHGDVDCLSGRFSSLSPELWRFLVEEGVGLPQLVWK